MLIFPGIGVLANVVGIVAGGVAGTICGDRLAERFKDTLLRTCAVVVICRHKNNYENIFLLKEMVMT